jgi:Lon protease-like protein
LFPLDVVLLPGTPLPLHIFEPRYQEMIGECLDMKKPFGVVRAKEDEGVAEIGCTADIIAVPKKYDDGRMDIVAQGIERFEILELNQERSFLQAEVLYFRDGAERATGEQIARAVELHNEILELAGAEPQAATEEQEPQLSFHLAGALPLDLDFKQSLLGMKSEAERLQAVIQYLEAIVPNLRRAMHVRRKAGGNGHAM